MQSNHPPRPPVQHDRQKGPATSIFRDLPQRLGARFAAMSRRNRLLLIAGAAVTGVLLLSLIVVNLLISADWVRDRIAARIKEQTGRELKVNGTTALLFTPGPKVIISDAVITDPEARAGTADLAIGRLVLDLSLVELMSRQVDAERVILDKPVLTVRLGEHDRPQETKPDKPKSSIAKVSRDKPRREVKLRNVRIADGTIEIVQKTGKTRRIENIAAKLSLPGLADPLTGRGTFDWKGERVNFSFGLSTLADLRQKRSARFELALDTAAIAARFDGSVQTRPVFAGQGNLSAKAHSIPSLLAWMREKPAASTAIGDGELSSQVEWKDGEIAFSHTRFALEHAVGHGQAVVTLKGPRPHLRAALALEHLDLNPILATGRSGGDTPARPPASAPDSGNSPPADSARDWFTRPGSNETAGASDYAVAEPEAPAGPDTPPPAGAAVPASDAVAEPASFDADVNLNVRRTRLAHLDFGPASLGLAFRDGVLNATLGGMELYEGHATGRLVLDASKPVPSFNSDLRLDGVDAKALLSDAAQMSMLEGHAKLELQIGGAGRSAAEIKSTLQGQGNLAVSGGAIEGVNLTEMIAQLGEGQLPDLRQGPGAKTEFSDLGGSFTIRNGIAESSNLQMTSPLLKVAAAGSVDLNNSTIDMLANPEIVAGAEGRSGANDLAGLSIPVRIEGPLDRPTISPEVKSMFADPEKTGKAVNKIGKALEKKFKGKPVGEAIGRFLGNVQIGRPDDDEGPPESQANRRPNRKEVPEAKPAPKEDEDAPSETAEPDDPELDQILR